MEVWSLSAEDHICLLCGCNRAALFHMDRWRPYLRCPDCLLVYVPIRWHPSADEAKRRYDLHQNRPNDTGYREFLNRLVEPLAARLPSGAQGLDFGAGPGPTLSLLFSERGFPVKNYDPLYADDRSLLNTTYDFVSCTETVEHFTRPDVDWKRLIRLVKPGGLLGVMTARLEAGRDFGRWRYVNDRTHVGFYSTQTLEWLAMKYGLKADFVAPTVVLFAVPRCQDSASGR